MLKGVFARKTNEKQTPVFEVNKNAENVSAYMTMFQLIGHLLVQKKVFELNNKEIEKAAEVLPSITKFLTPLQYYRMQKQMKPKKIYWLLGVQNVVDIEESNDP